MKFGPLFKRNNKLIKHIGAVFLVLFLTLSFSFSGFVSNNLFKANSLVNIKHAPFDGLVFPYAYGVDWVRMSGMGVDRLVAYNEVPLSVRIEPLVYNASELAIPADSLGFSSEQDLRIRNSKITYTVPYGGTYTLDGIEGGGSHPGVDIALPTGTPVIAIGNGVVVKTENQAGGFGNHVVLRHNDFPSFNDPNVLTTYFSSYAHLESMSVNVGDVVRKGQLLGTVGSTGTATTPHLHFQIDKDTAPWHPFWPFSATEAANAGLTFFEAINRGLGRQLVYENTINPMVYVQKYFSPGSNIVADNSGSNGSSSNQPIAVTESDFSGEISIISPSLMLIDESYEVELSSSFPTGSRSASISEEEFSFRSSLISSYSIPRYLDFSAGPVRVNLTPKELGNMNLSLNVNGNNYFSSNVDVRLFYDLANNDKDVRYISTLKSNGIVNGYADGNFKPDNLVNKAEAAKIIAGSLPSSIRENTRLIDINFSDVSEQDWYYDSVRLLASLGAIDITRIEFEAAKAVNLAEFLKMIFIAYQVDFDYSIDESMLADEESWYKPFANIAVSKGVVSEDELARISSNQLRRDVSRVMARLINLAE